MQGVLKLNRKGKGRSLPRRARRLGMAVAWAIVLAMGWGARAADGLDRTGTQWFPYAEWSLTNATFEGNPYDLESSAVFQHAEGETRRTGLFYAGDNVWKFRFTGTRVGRWKFAVQSGDPDLNGQGGQIEIAPNANPEAHGFLTSFGNKWGWQGTGRAFVPQLVMYDDLPDFAGKPDKIRRDIQTFIEDHGFNGFHIGVLARWFDFDHPSYDGIDSSDPNPDARTFEALEMLITMTHRAGGMVHLWAWGDEQRRMTPDKWGKNGAVDRRLQRYLAARLGPLPGWSVGYGFDLDEWVDKDELRQWHTSMHKHFGWRHFLGGRSGGPNQGTDHKGWQIFDGLDYAGYEHHRPTYEVYRAAMMANPGKPVFSEDRFRVRQPSPYPEKDYDEILTRRGLWDSTMAGGVANIWGNMARPGGVYERKEWIKTWARFFDRRFLKDLEPANRAANGRCLQTPDGASVIIYREDTESIDVDLSGLPAGTPALAVDTRKPYEELELGAWGAGQRVWRAPHKSDWALAVGRFGAAP